MQCQVTRCSQSACVAPRVSRSKLIVRVQAAPGAAPAAKTPLPKDAEGVKAMIAKSHEMHGQGRSMFFCTSGAGKRATAGTAIAHADDLNWNVLSTGSMDQYNIYS